MALKIFGYPVQISASFLVTLAMLGFFSTGGDMFLVVAFVVFAFLAILIHEFGHAFAANSQGALSKPEISLQGLGGITTYRLAQDPSRIQSIFISVSGPIAGALAGVLALVLWRQGIIPNTASNSDLMNLLVFVTIGWSIFNLFPILPLDGGHIVSGLMPGNQLERQRRSAMVSITFASVAGTVLWFSTKEIFIVGMLGFLALQNLTFLSDTKSQPPTPQLDPSQQ